MALETGTYIDDLVITNPLGSDLKSQGDDHIRLIKKTIKNTFPNIAGEVTATHTALSAANRGKNKIINGDFSIWQRATSFAAISSGDYSADRWIYRNSSSAVHTISRSTDTPTVAQAGRLFTHSLLIDCTTADASIAAGDIVRLSQEIEGRNFVPIAQRSFTLSFWVKATKTGIYCVQFKNSISDRSYVSEYTINTTNTWEKKTVTVTASPSAGTWNYTTGIGLSVGFTLASGSTFQTTADTWQTGNFNATANQVNGVDSAANNFLITGVQVESGTEATEFEHKLYSETFSDCQRYYEKTVGTLFFKAANAGDEFRYSHRFQVQKRATPSIALSGGSVINASTNTAVNITNDKFDHQIVSATAGGVAVDSQIVEINSEL